MPGRGGGMAASPLLFVAEALLMLWPAAAMRMEDASMERLAHNRSASPEDRVVAQFDGNFYRTNRAANMRISHHGAKLYSGTPTVWDFTARDHHKEFTVEFFNRDNKDQETPTCSQGLFIKSEALPGLCGTQGFSAPRRTCTRLPAGAVDEVYDRVRRYTPATDRGFGIEFEFVARNPDEAQKAALERYFREELDEEEAEPQFANGTFGGVLGIKHCLQDIIGHGSSVNEDGAPRGGHRPCAGGSDCDLSEFCLNCTACNDAAGQPCEGCEAAGGGVCLPRLECEGASAAVGGICPIPLERWNWEEDSSVRPLAMDEVQALGANLSETMGTAFEVNSPGPPYVLSGERGLRSTVEVITALRRVGIQAGPSSGLHVHVNVLSRKAPGVPLGYAGVARVWAAYAKYQVVIDEMFSPGRINSRYANPLFLGECEAHDDSGGCSSDPCGCNKRIYMQLHDWVTKKGNSGGNAQEFCNTVLSMGYSDTPCNLRFPHQRYTQLNLASLAKFGTIEFRGHSATYDVERIATWIQFLIAFVEYFGRGAGKRSMKLFFIPGNTAEHDYARLQRAQRRASAADLFSKLRHAVDPGMRGYFGGRAWERGDAMCAPRLSGPPGLMAGVCNRAEDNFVPALLFKQEGNIRTMEVQVPLRHLDSQLPEYVQVMMPEGDIWVVKILYEDGEATQVRLPDYRLFSISRTPVGYICRFNYDSQGRRQIMLEEELNRRNRCCCTGDICKWYPEDTLTSTWQCPTIKRPGWGAGECAISKKFCWLSSCRRTYHSRRRSLPKHTCEVTTDRLAYFTGGRCKGH